MITALQDPVVGTRAKGEGRGASPAQDVSFEAFLASEDGPREPFRLRSDHPDPSPQNDQAARADTVTPTSEEDSEVPADSPPAEPATDPTVAASGRSESLPATVFAGAHPGSCPEEQADRSDFTAGSAGSTSMQPDLRRPEADHKAGQEDFGKPSASPEQEVGDGPAPSRSRLAGGTHHLFPMGWLASDESRLPKDAPSDTRKTPPENEHEAAEGANAQVGICSDVQSLNSSKIAGSSPDPAPRPATEGSAEQIIAAASSEQSSSASRGPVKDSPAPREPDMPAAARSPAADSLAATRPTEMGGKPADGRASPHRSNDPPTESSLRPDHGSAKPDAQYFERSDALPARPFQKASVPIDGSGTATLGQTSRASPFAVLAEGFPQKASQGTELAAAPSTRDDRQPRSAVEPRQNHESDFFPAVGGLQVHYGSGGQRSFGVERPPAPASGSRRARIEPGQVARQIAQSVGKSHADRIEIVLHPEELGKVRMVMTPGDNPSVTIQADNADTLELLRRNVDQLARELRQSGFGDAMLSFSDEGERRTPLRPALMQADSGSGTDMARSDPKTARRQSHDPQRQLDIRI